MKTKKRQKTKVPSALKLATLFSEEELQQINDTINNVPESNTRINQTLSRITYDEARIPETIVKRLTGLAESIAGKTLRMVYPPSCVEYSNKYGEPHLNPHFDGDSTNLIIDYQLSSNTSWSIGVNFEVHQLEDNSAVVFHPNKNVHWRPVKAFQDGEYVRMMFFRFFDPINTSDYSYLPHHPDDPIFAEVKAFKDSLSLD